MPEAGSLVLTGPDYPSASLLRRWDMRNGAQSGSFLPHEPNTEAKFGPGRILWLGPCEWLFLDCDPDAVRAEVAVRLSGELLHLCDVSGSLSRFQICGDKARSTLSKICSLDLHPRSFAPGTCVQTRLADLHVIMHLDQNTFGILVETPSARHLEMWLREVGAEYRMERKA